MKQDRTHTASTALATPHSDEALRRAVHVSTTTIPPFTGDTYEGRLLLAEMHVGYRIMRKTEIAPAWWGTPREVGETGSVFVAERFCSEQNAVTMNPNNAKRIEFYAEPLYAVPTAPARRLLAVGVKRGNSPFTVKAVNA